MSDFTHSNFTTSLSRLQKGPEALRVHFEIIDNVHEVAPVFHLSYLLKTRTATAKSLLMLRKRRLLHSTVGNIFFVQNRSHFTVEPRGEFSLQGDGRNAISNSGVDPCIELVNSTVDAHSI